MIKIDVTKAVSPRFVAYLLGLIPGVFFESSIAVGDPHFSLLVMSRVREVYSFGPYALLVWFLASSLFIGSAFFIAAWGAERLIFLGFELWRYIIRSTFGSQWLYRRFATLQGIPPKQTIFIRSLSKLIFWAREREFSTKARPVLKCLRVATKRLLEKRYGIEVRRQLEPEVGVWYSVLGKPLKSVQESVLVSRVFLSCGLAGLTALYATPALRERHFITLSTAFAVLGLWVSIHFAFWSFDPVRKSLLQLKSVLLELSENPTFTDGQHGAENGPCAKAEAGATQNLEL